MPEISPDLPPHIADHIQRYLANGEEAHDWMFGVPTLLLTITGRKSGRPIVLGLTYGRDRDRYVLVASNGGSPDHPNWFKNVMANPRIRVKVKNDEFDAVARVASAEERPRLWEIMTTVYDGYNEYQTRTDRQLPVVILERV